MSIHERTSHRLMVGEDEIGYERGWEWKILRAQCQALKMENCYNRYIERLVVTNVALFLFIMELLLIIHIIILYIFADTNFFQSLPYWLVMISMPFILRVCFMDKSKVQFFRFWNVIVSCGAVASVIVMDTLVNLAIVGLDYRVVSSYEFVMIISVYFFLPISFYGKPYLLGLAVSVFYIGYDYFTIPSTNPLKMFMIICFAIYLFTLNVLMMAFRLGIECQLRKKVLSRRQLLNQTLLLKVVMQKERDMINTILPPEIADSLQQEIRTRIEDQRLGKNNSTPRTLFVELHSDVSILVADMVNYTHLTTRLDVRDLVKILHGLFLKFDLAAQQNNVLRIKFLGDSYNCVSGIPHYNRRHAKSCVALALEMIQETKLMRLKTKQTIDMRIGVHSGEVFSGIIGLTKWQYDIWSRDVDIANRLETHGKPGMVHVSQATLSMLDNEYQYVDRGPLSIEDPILLKAHIKTYLIGPQKRKTYSDSYRNMYDYSSESVLSTVQDIQDVVDVDHEEIRAKTHRGMLERVEHMPVGRIQLARIFDFSKKTETGNEDTLFKCHITSFWRLFRNSDIEWNYMNEPDYFIKYSLLMVFFVGCMLFLIHLVQPFETYSLNMGILLLLIFIICLGSFYKTIWVHVSIKWKWTKPRFFLSRWLFRLSEYCEEQLVVRLFISFSSIFLVYIMATIRTVLCNANEFELSLIEADVENKPANMQCFEPWVVTQNVLMVLMLMIFFYGLPLVFKVGLVVFICVSHVLTVEAFIFAWRRTLSTNISLPSEYAHIWNMVAFCLLVVLQELHLTYISKVNYHSKLRYEEKLRQTEIRTQSIQIILANILPTHVADIFLEQGRGEDLFYESYSKVAVMFAFIENFQPDKVGLRVLNEYISYYDDLLAEYVSNFKVEKIKVIGWTYMAACGLRPENMTEFSQRQPERKKKHRSIFRRTGISFRAAEEEELPRRRTFVPRYIHPDLNADDNCVLTMLNFALDMLRVMQDIALQNMYLDYGGSMRGQLKIGISHGPIMAGVVGLSPPHYDIWGHPVNMASRMTSTGVLGSIQVTENTALILRYFDIKCDYRGMTYVKGVGEIPTYLVALDETLNFQNYDDADLDTLLIINNSMAQAAANESRVVYIETTTSASDGEEKEMKNEKASETERKPGGTDI
ncbi:hypothetical protein ACLKA7_017196 [Drosophila subpalustris]